MPNTNITKIQTAIDIDKADGKWIEATASNPGGLKGAETEVKQIIQSVGSKGYKLLSKSFVDKNGKKVVCIRVTKNGRKNIEDNLNTDKATYLVEASKVKETCKTIAKSVNASSSSLGF